VPAPEESATIHCLSRNWVVLSTERVTTTPSHTNVGPVKCPRATTMALCVASVLASPQ
jgi:hypothetical protein